ncbi:MAG TPA: hypothetical protein VMT53_08725 [Terriglobales bacterium]|nr:hypothetical protein [Terriglobales bacterium]
MKPILCALLALTAAVALVPAVHAQCTAATLTGNYGLTFAGFTSRGHSTQGNEVPWVVVGVVTFDGTGNVSLNYAGAINGSPFANQTGSGTYAVSSDCTGSMSFTGGDAAGTHASMVLVSGGSEIFCLITDAGSSATFDLKKQ